MTAGTEDLISAITRGDASRVEQLISRDRGLARARDGGGVSAILLARYRGEAQIVETLRRAAGDLDVFEAAALGDRDRLAALLDQDPDLATAWSPDGFTPLHLAAFFGHRDAAELLLDRGGDVALVARNALAVTPLHSAVAGRASDVAGLLVAHGADINARQEGGFTPLHGAAQNGDQPLVALLLAAGADPAAPTADGQRPADMARDAGHEALAELLGSR